MLVRIGALVYFEAQMLISSAVCARLLFISMHSIFISIYAYPNKLPPTYL